MEISYKVSSQMTPKHSATEKLRIVQLRSERWKRVRKSSIFEGGWEVTEKWAG
jgi:hypothetical protein